MHNRCMLKRTCVYLQPGDLKTLEQIGKQKGGLKLAQMIRLAIGEYIVKERGVQQSKEAE
jgi:hypothetical protein